ncbi:hypothetical protein D3C71_1053990 [compost metagenome]
MNAIIDADLKFLATSETEDIDVLIDHLTDSGAGRLSMSSSTTKALYASKGESPPSPYITGLIVEELQRFGGNSLVNLFRGGSGVPYAEIVRDVADHVGACHSKSHTTEAIEGVILLKVLEQSLAGMSGDQRRDILSAVKPDHGLGSAPVTSEAVLQILRSTRFSQYRLAAILAGATTTALLGRGLSAGAAAGLSRSLPALVGPIGWAVAALWTAFDLASPAYRVTVPCVIHIAYMRQKALTQRCPACGHSISLDAKFCEKCGHRCTGILLGYGN